ncbi:MAG: nascent polypeptide-associated complex protein [Nitrososphaeria archaeon]
MKRMSRRELRRMQSRMLQGMGLDIEELGKAIEVIFDFGERRLVVREPSVVSMTLEKEKVFQVVGGTLSEEEKEEAPKEEVAVADDDVAIVAAQAGVSLEEARSGLIEAQGDLARAILLLKSRETSPVNRTPG